MDTIGEAVELVRRRMGRPGIGEVDWPGFGVRERAYARPWVDMREYGDGGWRLGRGEGAMEEKEAALARGENAWEYAAVRLGWSRTASGRVAGEAIETARKNRDSVLNRGWSLQNAFMLGEGLGGGKELGRRLGSYGVDHGGYAGAGWGEVARYGGYGVQGEGISSSGSGGYGRAGRADGGVGALDSLGSLVGAGGWAPRGRTALRLGAQASGLAASGVAESARTMLTAAACSANVLPLWRRSCCRQRWWSKRRRWWFRRRRWWWRRRSWWFRRKRG